LTLSVTCSRCEAL